MPLPPSSPGSESDFASDASSESYAGSAASIAAIQDSAEHRFTEEISQAYDPLPLDRALVVQAQLSGLLHARAQELGELQAAADGRLEKVRELSSRGRDLLKRTAANVDWLRGHVSHLHARTRRDHPVEYAQATERTTSPPGSAQ